jgi:hypothetical protein
MFDSSTGFPHRLVRDVLTAGVGQKLVLFPAGLFSVTALTAAKIRKLVVEGARQGQSGDGRRYRTAALVIPV